jgi:hypothetical protein
MSKFLKQLIERIFRSWSRQRSQLRKRMGEHETSEELVRRYMFELEDSQRARSQFDSQAEAQRRFLEEMERQHQEERSRLRRDEELLQSHERSTYRLFATLALVCIGFVILGGYLILRGSAIPGALSEVLGLASGAGAGLLKSMAARDNERRQQIAKESREMVEVLQAMQAALAAGGTQVVETASWLRTRVTKSHDR